MFLLERDRLITSILIVEESNRLKIATSKLFTKD